MYLLVLNCSCSCILFFFIYRTNDTRKIYRPYVTETLRQLHCVPGLHKHLNKTRPQCYLTPNSLEASNFSVPLLRLQHCYFNGLLVATETKQWTVKQSFRLLYNFLQICEQTKNGKGMAQEGYRYVRIKIVDFAFCLRAGISVEFQTVTGTVLAVFRERFFGLFTVHLNQFLELQLFGSRFVNHTN